MSGVYIGILNRFSDLYFYQMYDWMKVEIKELINLTLLKENESFLGFLDLSCCVTFLLKWLLFFMPNNPVTKMIISADMQSLYITCFYMDI